MTENKRFTVDRLTITEKDGITYLLEEQGGVNALCSRINGLYEQNQKLKKECGLND